MLLQKAELITFHSREMGADFALDHRLSQVRLRLDRKTCFLGPLLNLPSYGFTCSG